MNYYNLLKSILAPLQFLLILFLLFLASVFLATILFIFAAVLIYPFSLFMTPLQIKISFSVAGYIVLVYLIYNLHYGGEQ